MPENNEYFQIHKYRNPQDYSVRAYVLPKIKFMEENGCFQGKNIKILDVAGGNGTFSAYFKKYTQRVVSVDYSEQLLRSNPARLRSLGDAYRLPFRDKEFDIVFEANLLHHLDEPHLAINEMKRCSNNYLIFIEPNRYNPIMFFFGLFVKPERGTLISFKKRWENMIKSLDIEVCAATVTGMISQQNTPGLMVPFLKFFDFNFALGEYVALVCKRG